MATSGAIDQERVRSLASTSSGMLLLPDDDGYDKARRIHNASIDKRPALIARCLGTADVVDAVALARETGLEVSVRGGGHNVAGRGERWRRDDRPVVDEGHPRRPDGPNRASTGRDDVARVQP